MAISDVRRQGEGDYPNIVKIGAMSFMDGPLGKIRFSKDKLGLPKIR